MSPEPHAGPRRFVFITPVWGDAYTDRFVKLSLPSQLSGGNLGAVPSDAAAYLIYTRRKHARAIARSAAYRRLKDLVPTSIRLLDDLPEPGVGGDHHALMTAAYTRGIASAGGDDACVFLTPDLLASDGSFHNLVRLARAGKRVVLVLGIRMTAVGATTCVARHAVGGSAVAAIPPRALVRACLDNLHPISTGHVVARGRVLAPQHFYWRVGDHGLLARGFHIHPLMVWPRNPTAAIRNTLDDEYIADACPDRSEWHTVTDSDEICVTEFSEARHKLDMLAAQPFSDEKVLRFMANDTTPSHRLHVLKRICFHTGGLDAPAWDETAARSDRLVDGYIAAFQEAFPDGPEVTPDGVVAIRNRLAAVLGRQKTDGGGESVPLRRLLLLGCAAPFWVVYRLVHHKLYRYLDRLNSEAIELRNLIMETREWLDTARRDLDLLRAEVAALPGKPVEPPAMPRRRSKQKDADVRRPR
ncbi:MAG TPA: hypothetical protein VH092_17430 [Urbifossiella sp.]|jgi:hypothetical protein|nr:hypothetical protein [Urbifossiella sp.]